MGQPTAATAPPCLVPVRTSPVPGIGMEARCPHCTRWTSLWEHHGTLGTHTTAQGPLCPGSGLAVTLAAALARDHTLNPEERTIRAWAFRHLHGCKGPLIHEECHHPACHRATGKGLRWTLNGWRKTDSSTALF